MQADETRTQVWTDERATHGCQRCTTQILYTLLAFLCLQHRYIVVHEARDPKKIFFGVWFFTSFFLSAVQVIRLTWLLYLVVLHLHLAFVAELYLVSVREGIPLHHHPPRGEKGIHSSRLYIPRTTTYLLS